MRFQKGYTPWNKGVKGTKLSEEHKRKIRENHAHYWQGKKRGPLTDSTKSKIGAVHKGKIVSETTRQKLREFNWKGDNVKPRTKYSRVHVWVYKQLGKPDKCENCGNSGLTKQKIHWANISHEYKYDTNDWARLCVPCHKLYDLGKIRIGILL